MDNSKAWTSHILMITTGLIELSLKTTIESYLSHSFKGNAKKIANCILPILINQVGVMVTVLKWRPLLKETLLPKKCHETRKDQKRVLTAAEKITLATQCDLFSPGLNFFWRFKMSVFRPIQTLLGRFPWSLGRFEPLPLSLPLPNFLSGNRPFGKKTTLGCNSIKTSKNWCLEKNWAVLKEGCCCWFTLDRLLPCACVAALI